MPQQTENVHSGRTHQFPKQLAESGKLYAIEICPHCGLVSKRYVSNDIRQYMNPETGKFDSHYRPPICTHTIKAPSRVAAIPTGTYIPNIPPAEKIKSAAHYEHVWAEDLSNKNSSFIAEVCSLCYLKRRRMTNSNQIIYYNESARNWYSKPVPKCMEMPEEERNLTPLLEDLEKSKQLMEIDEVKEAVSIIGHKCSEENKIHSLYEGAHPVIIEGPAERDLTESIREDLIRLRERVSELIKTNTDIKLERLLVSLVYSRVFFALSDRLNIPYEYDSGSSAETT